VTLVLSEGMTTGGLQAARQEKSRNRAARCAAQRRQISLALERYFFLHSSSSSKTNTNVDGSTVTTMHFKDSTRTNIPHTTFKTLLELDPERL
jgi:hypothetical protein